MASQELGDKVLGFRVDRWPKPVHYVAVLFEHVYCFVQLHVAFDDEHIDDPNISDLLVLIEHFPELLFALLFVQW